MTMYKVSRLHWGCGNITPEGWINSDLHPGPGVDISGNILDGLPLEDASIDYISSQHALPELKIFEQVNALEELYRVLRPGGVLRLCLPDLDKAIAAYQSRNSNYFLVWDWDTISGNFITQMLWYNYTHTMFTHEFTEELLRKAGFREVRRAQFRQTNSQFPEIVELDNRENESLFIEGYK
jgi:predicted SAM-dependent methyltransferase